MKLLRNMMNFHGNLQTYSSEYLVNESAMIMIKIMVKSYMNIIIYYMNTSDRCFNSYFIRFGDTPDSAQLTSCSCVCAQRFLLVVTGGTCCDTGQNTDLLYVNQTQLMKLSFWLPHSICPSNIQMYAKCITEQLILIVSHIQIQEVNWSNM